MKNHLAILLATLLLMPALFSAAPAENEARDIAKNCTLSASHDAKHRSHLKSESLDEYWACAQGDTLSVETNDGSRAQGVVVSFLGGAALTRDFPLTWRQELPYNIWVSSGDPSRRVVRVVEGAALEMLCG